MTHENLDQLYLEAHAAASRAMRTGDIRAFSVTYDAERGRVITVETESGWHPDPMYCDFWPAYNGFCDL